MKKDKYWERRCELFSNIAIAILVSIGTGTIIINYLSFQDIFWRSIFLFTGTLITLLIVFFVVGFLLDDYYGMKRTAKNPPKSF